jgi:hypothetical protein
MHLQESARCDAVSQRSFINMDSMPWILHNYYQQESLSTVYPVRHHDKALSFSEMSRTASVSSSMLLTSAANSSLKRGGCDEAITRATTEASMRRPSGRSAAVRRPLRSSERLSACFEAAMSDGERAAARCASTSPWDWERRAACFIG